ncbi:MAG: hypothetical protein ACYTEK_10760, partial [Planctomycetota bacterium]
AARVAAQNLTALDRFHTLSPFFLLWATVATALRLVTILRPFSFAKKFKATHARTIRPNGNLPPLVFLAADC